jgi:RNA polymerase sigma-70 factor, ECF subfamily
MSTATTVVDRAETAHGRDVNAGPEAAWRLVMDAQAGDRDAVARWWQWYRPRIARFIVSRGVPSVEVEDLVSETFTRALTNLGTLTVRPAHDPGAWLFTIARNLVFDRTRRTQHRRTVVCEQFGNDDTESYAACELAWAGFVVGVEEQVLAGVRRRELARLLSGWSTRLCPTECELLRLRFVEDRTYAETARQLGRSYVATKAIQARALAKLRDAAGAR